MSNLECVVRTSVMCDVGDVCLIWSYELLLFFFFKQKTAYEIVSRDWSSDVCSSDLTYDTQQFHLSTCVV